MTTGANQSMVEKVARALLVEEMPCDWESANIQLRRIYTHAARAAIHAMRDATPEMQALFVAARPESPCAVWNKVIDAALNEDA